MKKTILAGLSLVIASNSIALAESDRVSRINAITAMERVDLQHALIQQIDEVRGDLEIIKDQIKQTKDLRMAAASSSLKATVATAVSGLATILLVTKLPQLKKSGQQFEAVTATAVIGLLTTYFGKEAYDETVTSEERGKDEIASEREQRRLQAELEKLETDLEALKATLTENNN